MKPAKDTDWNAYYSKPIQVASISRWWTVFYLNQLLAKFIEKESPKIVELGGGDSCCIDSIMKEFSPSQYSVVDKNQLGLEKLKKRFASDSKVSTEQMDLLESEFSSNADLVLSLGLIEHFDKSGTEKLIETHFKSVQAGGLVLITFPTPTPLYKVARKISEALGLWIFHDERPLMKEEVEATANKWGQRLHYSINWPIIFTQGIVIYKKS